MLVNNLTLVKKKVNHGLSSKMLSHHDSAIRLSILCLFEISTSVVLVDL